MKWLICAGAVLAVIAVTCGFTTIPFPGRKTGDRRIACVGDSITYGCTIPACFWRSYPRKLGRMLGNEFCVCNFGVNDRTMQETSQKPYIREKAWRNSRAFEPEIVILLLGSNDSKAANWVSDEHFTEQYQRFIQSYAALPSCRKIILCTPPRVFRPAAKLFYLSNDLDIDRIEHIAELVRRLALENGLSLVELYEPTLNRRDLFGMDGAHPNAAGAGFLADRIKTAVLSEPEQRA